VEVREDLKKEFRIRCLKIVSNGFKDGEYDVQAEKIIHKNQYKIDLKHEKKFNDL